MKKDIPLECAETRSADNQRGFALVIALSLMAFILLLLLSITTLVRVETQSSEISISTLKARQNALLGIHVAIGQLQKTAGSDQRVTATADMLNVQNPRWTGVWRDPDLSNNANLYLPEDRPQLLTWLVSGNENVTLPVEQSFLNGGGDAADAVLTIEPGDYAGAADLLDGDHVWMLRNSIESDGSIPIEDLRVQVPRVQVSDGNRGSAHYAWWVGDQGVKAKVNLGELEAGVPNRFERILNVPQRAGVQLTTGLSTLFNAGADELEKVTSLLELGLLDGAATALDDGAKDRYHDITAFNFGVLSDTREGGLKWDLTSAFESASDFGTGPADSDTFLARNALRFPSAGTSVFPPLPGGGTLADGNVGGPEWSQVRSFYNLKADASDGTVGASPHTDSSHGLYPVMTNFQLYFMVTEYIDESRLTFIHPSTPPREFEWRESRLWYFPAVVLWNPYDVSITLSEKSYIRLTTNRSMGRKPDMEPDGNAPRGEQAKGFGLQYAGQGGQTRGNFSTEPQLVSLHNVVNGQGHVSFFQESLYQYGVFNQSFDPHPLTFTVAAATFAPGEVKVFSPAQHSRLVDLKQPGSEGNLLSEGWFPERGIFHDPRHMAKDPTIAGIAQPAFMSPSDEAPGTSPLLGRASSSSVLAYRVGFGTDAPKYADLEWGLDQSIADPDSANDDRVLQKFIGLDLRGIGNYYSSTSDEEDPSILFERALDWFDPSDPAVSSIPLSVGRLEQQQTENYEFPLFGFQFAMKFSEDSLQSPYEDTAFGDASHVQWLGQYNPRANFQGRSPFEYEDDSMANLPNFVPFAIANPLGAAELSDEYEAFPAVGLSDDPLGNNSSVLFELPTNESPVVSVGQLMHANFSKNGNFLPGADFSNPDAWGYSDLQDRTDGVYLYGNYSPAYVVGNSLADLRIPSTAAARDWGNDTSLGNGVHYDYSFLLNRALWDRTFFSSVDFDTAQNPQNVVVDEPLYNKRLVPSPFADGAITYADLRDFEEASANLLVEGAFNINSTSIEAWAAIIGSFFGVDPASSGNVSNFAPLTRMASPESGAFEASGSISDSTAFDGYRALSSTEVRTLATNIVNTIRARRSTIGPFLSLSEFINRSIHPSDPESARLSGALQQAIDSVPGTDPSNLNNMFRATEHFIDDIAGGSYGDFSLDPFDATYGATNLINASGSTASAAPGYLTQADILARLGSVLSARSDTFVIRAYGDHGVGTGSESRVWCEAVVQRIPEYVDTANNASDDARYGTALSTINDAFGRRFVILAVRWLNAEDV